MTLLRSHASGVYLGHLNILFNGGMFIENDKNRSNEDVSIPSCQL